MTYRQEGESAQSIYIRREAPRAEAGVGAAENAGTDVKDREITGVGDPFPSILIRTPTCVKVVELMCWRDCNQSSRVSPFAVTSDPRCQGQLRRHVHAASVAVSRRNVACLCGNDASLTGGAMVFNRCVRPRGGGRDVMGYENCRVRGRVGGRGEGILRSTRSEALLERPLASTAG